MNRFSHALPLIVAAAATSGCAPYIGTCSWIVPDSNSALQVVEARKPIAGECECFACDAPGRFLLERNGYTIEFWNGDRWYAELLVRARSKDGAVLTLSSDSQVLRRMAPHVPASVTHGFEYFVRGETDDGKVLAQTVSIHVATPDGHLLGTESIRLHVESRKDFSVEYL